MAEYDSQKKLVETLKSRLEEAEQQILDGEKLRKKLHNTILVRDFFSLELFKLQYAYICYLPILIVISLQELKGNIRVFCRVRPLLPNESGAVSYPKIGENLGRGIELMHNGKHQSAVISVALIHCFFQNGLIAFVTVFQLKLIHLLLIKYLITRHHKNTCSLKYLN